MNHQELQRILLMPEGLRAQYLAALKKPQKMSGGGEFGRKAQRINQATSFGDEPMGNQIVKDVGGNWLGGNVEKALDPLTRTVLNDTGVNNLRSRQGDEVANAYLKERPRHEAANNWVQGNLTNYVKKQMATEADPVRKLAEQGISHFPVVDDPRFWERKGELAREALSGRQVGKSDLAKQWENRSDSMIERDSAKGHQDMMHLSPGLYSEKDAWIKNAPPETKIYETSGNRPGFNAADLGFDHIMDVLREDLAEGRIRPEQLSKISMEQAVRRVHEYDQDKLKKMRETAIKQTEGMPVHKEYPEGYKWIELKAPDYNSLPLEERKQMIARLTEEAKQKGLTPENYIERYPESQLAEALKYEGDTMGHCVGGYCPDVAEGRSRIFSLRDAKGEPHVTVETEPSPFHPIGTNTKGTEFPSEITYGNNAVPISIPKEQKQAIYNLAKKLFEQQGGQPHARLQEAADAIIGKAPDRISQIKGKGNAKPVAKYIPMVQDFVKSHNWGGVEDLHHTDLIHLDANSDLAQAIQATGEKPPQYITQQELTDLSKKHNFPTWVNNVQKKADGGEVTRVYHGSPNKNLSEVQDTGVFGGLFGSPSKQAAESHGPNLYYADIPTHKILTHYALNHELPYQKVRQALLKANPKLAKNKELHDKIWNVVIDDEGQATHHLDEGELYSMFGTSDAGEAGFEAQRLRGQVSKHLGHHAIEIKDEHGTSYLLHPGVKMRKHAKGGAIHKAKGGSIKPVGYTKEKVTVSPSLDRMEYELMSMKHFKKAK